MMNEEIMAISTAMFFVGLFELFFVLPYKWLNFYEERS